MKENPFAVIGQVKPASTNKASRYPDIKSDPEAFVKLLEKMMEASRLQAAKKRQKAQESEALRAKRDKQERINELRALIASLKSRLMTAGGNDASLLAQISMAEMQLYWLTFGF